ncbi:MAG: hypothetical protein AAF997_15250 [Myxococcota bacterium]
MKRQVMMALIISGAVAATGCGDDDSGNTGGSGGTAGTGGSGGVGASGGSGGSGGDGGVGGDPGTPALEPLAMVPRFAVVSSDFSETSIAVLDDDFGIINESWINSGTTFPGLVATLSGDVVLPTRQAGDGSFAIVDRLNTDVVSRFFVPSGNLDGQVRTQGPNADYSSNPHDFVFVDETSAWATRYEPNLDPDALPENAGTDLLEIDPSDMTLTGTRIDLSEFNTTAMVMGMEVDVFARPDRGVVIGSTLVVGLDRLSGAFDAAGPGMVAVVDLDDNTADSLLLGDGLANCGKVAPVPGSPNNVMVSCVGFSQPFGDEAQIRASSGVLLLEVDDDGATIETTWRPSDDMDSALAVENMVPVGDARVAAVDFGDFGTGAPDVLYLMDIGTGEQEVAYESTGAFQIGGSAYDPDTAALYVPDSGSSLVIEFEVEALEAIEVGELEIAPGIGFPPQAVYLLE